MAVDGLKDQAKRLASEGEFVRAQREQAQFSVRQLAQRTELCNPYLSQVERGPRIPWAEILQPLETSTVSASPVEPITS